MLQEDLLECLRDDVRGRDPLEARKISTLVAFSCFSHMLMQLHWHKSSSYRSLMKRSQH